MVSLYSLYSGSALILDCPEKEKLTQDRTKIPETKVQTIGTVLSPNNGNFNMNLNEFQTWLLLLFPHFDRNFYSNK